MTEISQELAQRMADFVRHLDGLTGRGRDSYLVDEAQTEQDKACVPMLRALIDELPEPVDPDLIEAREMYCGGVIRSNGAHHVLDDDNCVISNADDALLRIRQGGCDGSIGVQDRLAAIKRGRELERAAK